MADVITRFKVESTQYDKKIKDAGKQLDKFKAKGSSLSGTLSQIESKLGMNITSIAKLGTVVGAVATAAKVAKDAFMSMESNIDELGRTTEAAKGAYDVFLQTINSGDWNNFIKNISRAITGARDLYDAMDRLGSVKSNNQAAIAIVQQQVQQLRLQKQQGINVDEQLKAASDRLQYLQNQAVTAGKEAGAKKIEETLMSGGVPEQFAAAIREEIINGGQDTFDKYNAQYKQLKAKGTVSQNVYDMDGNWGGTTSKFLISKLTEEEKLQYNIARAVTERETTLQEGINTFAQAVQAGAATIKEAVKINSYAGANKSNNTSLNIGGINAQSIISSASSKGEKATGLDAAIRAGSIYTGSLSNSIQGFSTGSIKEMETELKMMQEIMQGLTVGTDQYANALQRVNELQGTIKAAQGLEEDGKKAGIAWGATASTINSVGNALSNFQNPAAQIASIIAQAIANVALAYGDAMAKDQSSKSNIWAFLAAAAASTASMAVTISQIRKNTAGAYASGGVVPGNYNGGVDSTYIYASPGELILNRSQQQNIAGQLQQGNGMHLTATIKGEDIRLALNNNSRRRMRGENVTSK